jgi:hypothetical protein
VFDQLENLSARESNSPPKKLEPIRTRRRPHTGRTEEKMRNMLQSIFMLGALVVLVGACSANGSGVIAPASGGAGGNQVDGSAGAFTGGTGGTTSGDLCGYLGDRGPCRAFTGCPPSLS